MARKTTTEGEIEEQEPISIPEEAAAAPMPTEMNAEQVWEQLQLRSFTGDMLEAAFFDSASPWDFVVELCAGLHQHNAELDIAIDGNTPPADPYKTAKSVMNDLIRGKFTAIVIDETAKARPNPWGTLLTLAGDLRNHNLMLRSVALSILNQEQP